MVAPAPQLPTEPCTLSPKNVKATTQFSRCAPRHESLGLSIVARIFSVLGLMRFTIRQITPALLARAAAGAAFFCVASLPVHAQGTSVTPTTLNFGNQLVGTQRCSAGDREKYRNHHCNNHDATAPAPFAAGANCNGRKLSAGSSCMFNVTFKPTAPGAAAATLAVAFAAPLASQAVSLSGTGVEPWQASPQGHCRSEVNRWAQLARLEP